MLLGNVLLVVAFLILLHAGFSAVHCAWWCRFRTATAAPRRTLRCYRSIRRRFACLADEGLVTERYGDIGSLSVPLDVRAVGAAGRWTGPTLSHVPARRHLLPHPPRPCRSTLSWPLQWCSPWWARCPRQAGLCPSTRRGRPPSSASTAQTAPRGRRLRRFAARPHPPLLPALAACLCAAFSTSTSRQDSTLPPWPSSRHLQLLQRHDAARSWRVMPGI